ncbi:uncharacterized protein [Penaeus vannamei]|uniref:uncharacterized protein n=1 Tax=Penaeus vannamei TaxID=6689 RepID=UPI00387F3C3E
MCTSDDAIATVSMTKPVRKGYLTRYKKRFLGSNWREEWLVLHEDSSLEWYKEHDEADLLGAIVLKEAPEMIAAGPFALYVPGRPELPKNADLNNIMVFGTKTKDKTHWFLCKNADELNQWMTAISNTLPPPPDTPKAPSDESSGQPPPYNPAPSAPPEPYNVGYMFYIAISWSIFYKPLIAIAEHPAIWVIKPQFIREYILYKCLALTSPGAGKKETINSSRDVNECFYILRL